MILTDRCMMTNPGSELTDKTCLGRILLADDDELVREGLSERLRRSGFDCDCADGAVDALRLLRQESFDALIADIHMPGNAELELTQAVPRIAAGLPIILL